MWLGGICSLAIVAIMAMAKIPSVAVDDYKNWALRSPGREKVTVKTKYILMKYMTSSLLWFQNF